MKKLSIILTIILLATTFTSCSNEGLHLSSSQPISSNTSTSTEQVELKNEETLYGYTGTIEKMYIDRDTVYNVFEGFEDLPIIRESFYDNKKTIFDGDNVTRGNDKMEISINGKSDVSSGSVFVDYNLSDSFESFFIQENSIEKVTKEFDFMSVKQVEENTLDIISKLDIEYDFLYNVYKGEKGTIYDDLTEITYDPITQKPNPAPKLTVEEDFYYIEGTSCIDNIPGSSSWYQSSDCSIFFSAIYTKDGLVQFCIYTLNEVKDIEKVELNVTKEEALKKLGNYSITPTVNSQTLPSKQLVSINLVLYAIYDEPVPEKRDYIGKRQFSTAWEITFTDPINGNNRIDNDGIVLIDAITGDRYTGHYSSFLAKPYDVYKKVGE